MRLAALDGRRRVWARERAGHDIALLACLVRFGTLKEVAAALELHPGTLKNRLVRLHAETGRTTLQLVFDRRADVALYLATHPEPAPIPVDSAYPWPARMGVDKSAGASVNDVSGSSGRIRDHRKDDTT